MGDESKHQCCGIDDETMERYAMDRLQDAVVCEHLETCAFCKARVAERRQWIADLKRVLQAQLAAKPSDRTRRPTNLPMRPEDA